MKKILIIAVLCLCIANAFSGNKLPKIKIPAKGSSTEKVKSCFDHKTGQCLICKGTGKVKNPKYSKKRWTRKKEIKCKACDGKGKKTEAKKEVTTPKDEVEVQCPKCKKKFTHKLSKKTFANAKHIFFLTKCPHCKKKNLYRGVDNPLYNP